MSITERFSKITHLLNLIVMKFTFCIVALTIMVTVESVPAPAIELPTNEEEYFQAKLKSVQGAIKDTLNAGKDLETMETKLQNIVNFSSFFYRTESATEHATNRNAYGNGWKSGKQLYRNVLW